MRTVFAVCLGLLACIYGCTNKPDVEGARSVSDQVGKALNSKDTEKLKANLADHAVFLLANEPAIVGRDAIVSRYATAFKEIDYNVSLLSKEIEATGEFVLDRGSFKGSIKSTDGRASAPVLGKYLHVLKSQAGGRWKIWRAVWEFDNPVAAQTCSETGTRSCCCKSISGSDCIKRPETGCTTDYPISILLP